MTAPLKISKDDWIVFANGLSIYTYSQVLKNPRAARTMTTALVDTVDGTVFRRLVRCVERSSDAARKRCDELNMEHLNEGAMT